MGSHRSSPQKPGRSWCPVTRLHNWIATGSLRSSSRAAKTRWRRFERCWLRTALRLSRVSAASEFSRRSATASVLSGRPGSRTRSAMRPSSGSTRTFRPGSEPCSCTPQRRSSPYGLSSSRFRPRATTSLRSVWQRPPIPRSGWLPSTVRSEPRASRFRLARSCRPRW